MRAARIVVASLQILVLSVVPGCARRATGGAAALSPADRQASMDEALVLRPPVLVVDNRHWTDIVLWVETTERRLLRVGRASPGSTTRWSVGQYVSVAGTLRFGVDPVGVRGGIAVRHFSEPVRLAGGDSAFWMLERDLRRSVIEVRRPPGM